MVLHTTDLGAWRSSTCRFLQQARSGLVLGLDAKHFGCSSGSLPQQAHDSQKFAPRLLRLSQGLCMLHGTNKQFVLAAGHYTGAQPEVTPGSASRLRFLLSCPPSVWGSKELETDLKQSWGGELASKGIKGTLQATFALFEQ